MRGRLLNDRYALREQIGSGGMGEVWRARDTELERDVAVKVFMPQRGAAEDSGRQELLGRFQREARSAAALDSPYIVAVHDHGTDDGTPYLVMALVHGRSLHDLLLERGRMPLAEALSRAADVCRALRAAHGAGVVHRDIKPANIMVEDGDPGRAKVVDFGIAKFAEARSTDPQLTQTGQMPFGSVLYMAPEQFRQEGADGRTDLYALGCVLYELLVGRPPYTGSAAGVMYNHLHDTPLRPSRARTELPYAVDRLVLGLMARDPDGRPADAQAALEWIERVRESRGREEQEAASPEPSSGPAPDRTPDPAPDRAPPRAPVLTPRPIRSAPPRKEPRRGPVTTPRHGPTNGTSTGSGYGIAHLVSRCRSGRTKTMLAGLLVLGLALTTVLALEARSDSPPDPDPSGPSGAPPAGGYTIGVASNSMSDEGSPVRHGVEVVDAAIAEVERRWGRALPLKAVRARAAEDDAGGRLLRDRPGTVGLVGDTFDFTDDSAEGTDLSPGMAVVETCSGSDHSGRPAFAMLPADDEIGELEGRYLAERRGIDRLLMGNLPPYEAKGLRVGGVSALDSREKPDEMSVDEIVRRIGASRPDAVSLPVPPDERGRGRWLEAAGRAGKDVVLKADTWAPCTDSAALEKEARDDAKLPEGALRFRIAHDGGRRPDCSALPRLCAAPDDVRRLLRARGAPEMYDAALALADSFARTLPADRHQGPDRVRTAVRDKLAVSDVQGVLGRYRFRELKAVDRPVWVDRRENGHWRQIASLTL